jgi:hypothetical protein
MVVPLLDFSPVLTNSAADGPRTALPHRFAGISRAAAFCVYRLLLPADLVEAAALVDPLVEGM